MLKSLQNVLIVEDHPDSLLLLKVLISDFNLDFHAVDNGAEAIEFLKFNHIDLLITGFRMPKVNGVELLNWCRKNDRHFPVIFTTAEQKLFNSEILALGDCCATLLRKPFDFNLLHSAIIAADNLDHHSNCVHNSPPTYRGHCVFGVRDMHMIEH